MHPRYRHRVHQSCPAHCQGQGFVLIEQTLIPQQQGPHEGSAVCRKEASDALRQEPVQLYRQIAKASSLPTKDDRLYRRDFAIDPPAVIAVVILSIQLIRRPHPAGETDPVPRDKLGAGKIIVVYDGLRLGQLLPQKPQLQPAITVVYCRVSCHFAVYRVGSAVTGLRPGDGSGVVTLEVYKTQAEKHQAQGESPQPFAPGQHQPRRHQRRKHRRIQQPGLGQQVIGGKNRG